MNCTFTITDDDGKRVTSIAPGTYQISVTTPVVFSAVDLSGINDFTACKSFAQFELTGPGVNVFTTLQDGDEDKDIFKETFLANSTYTARDSESAGGRPRGVHHDGVEIAERAGQPVHAERSSTREADHATSSARRRRRNVQPSLRGTLAASVDATGKPKLTSQRQGGRHAQGRALHDRRSPTRARRPASGLQAAHKRNAASALTRGVPFVGKRTATLTLKKGQWIFVAGGSGKNTLLHRRRR